METREELYQSGQAGFEAIDGFFGRNCAIPAAGEKRSLYHRHEVPMETIPPYYVACRRTEVSQLPEQLFALPPPPGPPRNFPFGCVFPAKQRNPPKRMGERRELLPPLQYPPQGLHGAGVPAAEATDVIDNIKAAQLYGGITRIDYGRFK